MPTLNDRWERATRLSPDMKEEVKTIERYYKLPPLNSIGFRQEKLWRARYRRAHAINGLITENTPFYQPLEQETVEIVKVWALDPKHPICEARFWDPDEATASQPTGDFRLVFLANTEALRRNKTVWLGLSHWMLENITPQTHNYCVQVLRESFPAHSWERHELLHLVSGATPEYRALGLELMGRTQSPRIEI
jgi:hypothetical protein